MQNFTFQRDVAKFTLAEGKLYLCESVMNRVCAAVFRGKGRFQCAPPIETERKQLYRFYETGALDQEFNFLFILFADSTLMEFYRHLKFTRSEAAGDVRKQLEYALKYMGKPKGKEFNAEIMKAFLDFESSELFYSHFSKKKSNPMFFVINPYEAEEIRLMRRPKKDRFAHSREIVCQFHKKRDYDFGVDLSYDSKETIKLLDYKIDARIAKNFDFSASAEIKFTALRDLQNWIYLSLYRDLEVDSVSWAGGQEAVFFKGEKNPYVWIKCDPALRKDQTYTVKIDYHGELFRVKEDWVFIKSPNFWFPRINYRKKAKYNLTFHTPADFDFVSVGERCFRKRGLRSRLRDGFLKNRFVMLPLISFFKQQGFVLLDGGLASELEKRGHSLNNNLWSARFFRPNKFWNSSN